MASLRRRTGPRDSALGTLFRPPQNMDWPRKCATPDEEAQRERLWFAARECTKWLRSSPDYRAEDLQNRKKLGLRPAPLFLPPRTTGASCANIFILVLN